MEQRRDHCRSAAWSSVYNAGCDQPPVKLVAGLEPFPPRRLIVCQRLQDLLHDHPSHEGLARLQLVEPALDGRPRDAGRFQLGNAPAISARLSTASSPATAFRCFRARAMRSAASRLRLTEAACQRFGRTTGTNRPCSSRMIECMARLRDPTTQPGKLGGQLLVADQTARHARPHPSARIGECRKIAVENIQLETLPRCPCSAGRLIGGRPARSSCRARADRAARATRSRLRADRISARWMRSKSPDRCAAASRSRLTAAARCGESRSTGRASWPPCRARPSG